MNKKLNIHRLETAIWFFGLNVDEDEKERFTPIIDDLQAVLLKLGDLK